MLAAAAIVGREFDVELARRRGSRKRAGGTARALGGAHRRLAAAELTSVAKERIAFAHDEIAESLDRAAAARSDAPAAATRRRRRWPIGVPDRAGEIALHFDAAGEAAEAYRVGPARGEGGGARLRERRRPASTCSSRRRNATTPGELAEIRVALAHLAETGGRFDEVEELCDLAIEWFDGQADERRALTLERMRERARMELGQPARVTLDALVALDAEAKRLGFDRERVALLHR